MSKTKKVILVLVEGFSDKSALENIMNAIVTDEKVIFAVMNGDITSNRTTKSNNVLKKVADEAKTCLTKYKVQKADVTNIIHLVDVDGAFIPSSHIVNGNKTDFLYTSEAIIAKNKSAVEERNERKSMMLEKLIKTPKLFGIPYQVYYMSCNLDHVLYDIQNLNYEEKVEYADAFYEKYAGHEEQFLTFIGDAQIAIEGEYKQTWRYVETDLNSLQRCSNLHLFFDRDKQL